MIPFILGITAGLTVMIIYDLYRRCLRYENSKT